jgi:ribonuclease R
LNGAEDGDKVTFKLHNWVHAKALPEARINTILGKSGSNDANILSILAENDMVAEFPKEVEEYAHQIPLEIPEEECTRRRDLRNENVFTIDPEDAKDFDDALSIKKLENGNYYLGVHIADVTHYLTPKSVLDEEAHKRGTSVYLVDRVIPMLPEVLSNGVCSLRPNEDKLTYSCFMEIAPTGKLVDYEIEETVIHSKQRFTYEQAQEICANEVFTDTEVLPEESELSFIGFEVIDKHLGTIGKVEDVQELPKQLMLLVTYNGEVKYIPLVDDFIDYISAEEKEIWLTLPDGLLDL